MNNIARIILPALLAFSGAVCAQEQPAAQPAPPAASGPHYDPRGTTQSVCFATAVGSCAACTASCYHGQFALCSSGVAMTPPAGSACVKAAECKCR